jgi:hypothetical protein
VHGKTAALNHGVKMLLGALNCKDGELQPMCGDYDERLREIDALRENLADERALAKKTMCENTRVLCSALGSAACSRFCSGSTAFIASSWSCWRSTFSPKIESARAPQPAPQEVVVQANISDRLRVETSSQASKHERDLETALKRLERVCHSIVVLQEERGGAYVAQCRAGG